VDQWGEASAALYAAFAQVPKPTTLKRCPHCFCDEDEEQLLAPVPVRELSSEIVDLYAFCYTVGDLDDLRYFSPGSSTWS